MNGGDHGPDGACHVVEVDRADLVGGLVIVVMEPEARDRDGLGMSGRTGEAENDGRANRAQAAPRQAARRPAGGGDVHLGDWRAGHGR